LYAILADHAHHLQIKISDTMSIVIRHHYPPVTVRYVYDLGIAHVFRYLSGNLCGVAEVCWPVCTEEEGGAGGINFVELN